VGGQHRIPAARHEYPQAAGIGAVHLRASAESHLIRWVVGALAEPDAGTIMGQGRAVGSAASQLGLDHTAQVGEIGAQVANDPEGRVDVVWSSMSTVTVVPAALAAAQIRAMFAAAVFSPCSGRCRPTAVGLTETSAAPSRARPPDASRRAARRIRRRRHQPDPGLSCPRPGNRG
jgi:hypothetical protein